MNRNWLAALTLSLALAACSGDRIVLVPDPDGKVGRIEVSTQSGSQILSQANTQTTVSGTSAPSQPKAVSQGDIERTWAKALSAMPDLPRVYQLYFKTGTSELSPAGEVELPKVLDAVKNRANPVVLIAGHADAVGSEQLNIRVSRDRAQVIRDLLASKGVKASDMVVSSHGKRNPLVPTPDGVPEPRNRRVTVTVQ